MRQLGLMGFTAANQAEQLKRCYPQRAIPQPSDVLLTRWSQDPFAYGRYSFPAMGSTPTMRADLAQRWYSMVFAGEALSTSFPATLQGAYLSGIQAAKAMLA